MISVRNFRLMPKRTWHKKSVIASCPPQACGEAAFLVKAALEGRKKREIVLTKVPENGYNVLL